MAKHKLVMEFVHGSADDRSRSSGRKPYPKRNKRYRGRTEFRGIGPNIHARRKNPNWLRRTHTKFTHKIGWY
jgi:hypothetical protein